MPSIHPSEDPALGWMVPCLAVENLRASMDFYAALDLLPFGGKVDEKWIMLRNRAVEIHLFEGHIEKDVLNFRGGRLDRIRPALEGQGLTTREVSPLSWEVLDPDGRPLFFDSGADEVERYEAGDPLTIPIDGDVHAGDGMDLGNFTVCLNVADLGATLDFYKRVGFVHTGGNTNHGWAILARKDQEMKAGVRQLSTHLSAFQGMLPRDMLNFRGGHVGLIAGLLDDRGVDLADGVVTGEDGGESLTIRDPDGRPVFFDTTPPERLYAS